MSLHFAKTPLMLIVEHILNSLLQRHLQCYCQYVSCHVKSRCRPTVDKLVNVRVFGCVRDHCPTKQEDVPYLSKAATEGLGLTIKKEADHKKVSLFLVNMF